MNYKVRLQESEEGFSVSCPGLPGCWSQGETEEEALENIKAAVAKKELPAPEPGAMSMMLSKESYLNDKVGHWYPHLMFHIPKTEPESWGANLDDSPVVLDPRFVPEPETIFLVPVGRWSDGTPAPVM